MDVNIQDDQKVSRTVQAIAVFDPESNQTWCQCGESHSVFYHNGKIVTDAVLLTKGDIIRLGDTKLMFVPFCGDPSLHSWKE